MNYTPLKAYVDPYAYNPYKFHAPYPKPSLHKKDADTMFPPWWYQPNALSYTANHPVNPAETIYAGMGLAKEDILSELQRKCVWEHSYCDYGVEAKSMYTSMFNIINRAIDMVLKEYPCLSVERNNDEYERYGSIRVVTPLDVLLCGGPIDGEHRTFSVDIIEYGTIYILAYYSHCAYQYRIMRELFIDPHDGSWTAEFIQQEPMPMQSL
jgi:hypothetical protein